MIESMRLKGGNPTVLAIMGFDRAFLIRKFLQLNTRLTVYQYFIHIPSESSIEGTGEDLGAVGSIRFPQVEQVPHK